MTYTYLKFISFMRDFFLNQYFFLINVLTFFIRIIVLCFIYRLLYDELGQTCPK